MIGTKVETLVTKNILHEKKNSLCTNENFQRETFTLASLRCEFSLKLTT